MKKLAYISTCIYIDIYKCMFTTINQPAVPGSLGKHRHASLLAQSARVLELKNNFLMDPMIKAAEARILLGISYAQMRLLVKRGVLPPWRSGPRGHMKFRLSALTAYMNAGWQYGGQFK